jgi:FKBP-type peptidyl-prolyl cis-trans isomerase
MKKIGWAICLLGLLTGGISSCSNSDLDEFRDDNMAFLESLVDEPDLQLVGDSTNSYPGIFYKVYRTGTGRKPIFGETVKIIYAGWQWNKGIEYDDTLKIKDAYDYSTKGTYVTIGSTVLSCEGLSLAIQDMTVGSKWRIILPYYLAYGQSGTTNVKQYSTLLFDLELVSIKDDE